MKQHAVLALAAFLAVAPFASRAVFLDEHLFLRLAQSAKKNPLFPSDTPGLFFGVEIPNFAAHTHPPVGEYFLAVLCDVFGEFREVPFRLAFSIFAMAAVLGFYALARSFTAEPLLVALLFAVSPAFFVIAPTLMMDMPMLAFLLIGFAFYFRGRLALAGVCFTLAAGIGYTALVPIACLLAAVLAGRRPWKEVLCALAAPAALALWLLAMTLHYGEFPLVRTIQYLRQSPFHSLLATLSFAGGVAVCPGMIRLEGRSLITTAIVAVGLSLLAPVPTVAARAWFAVLAASGLMLLAVFVRSALNLVSSGKNTGEAVFVLWAPAVLLFFITVADMINARYILLALPALYLVVFRQATRAQLLPAIGATALLALALAYADMRLVNSYRAWADNTIPPLQRQGFRVWNAAESGLRFYVERTGAATLSAKDERPAGTDLIVRHGGRFVPFRYGLSERVETLQTVLKEVTFTSRFPIRTYNKAAGAGFHDTGAGLLPFMFSLAPLDRIEVAQISPFVRQFPQESTDPERAPVWSPAGPILKQSQAERMFPMRIPARTQIQYELDGTGSVENTGEGIRLINTSGATIVWRRFRIVPLQFMEN